MTVKFCVKCGDPIRRPELPEPDERCDCCADDGDGVEAIKQEAYVEGWFAALDQRDEEEKL